MSGVLPGLRSCYAYRIHLRGELCWCSIELSNPGKVLCLGCDHVYDSLPAWTEHYCSILAVLPYIIHAQEKREG